MVIFCLILLGSLFKIDHWSIFKRDPSSIKQTDRFSSENQAESSRIVRVSRCRSMWRRGGRKPAGRIRPGSDFIYTKNFAWPGSDFIGGRCDRKSQFSRQEYWTSLYYSDAYTDFLLGHLRQIDHWSILGKGMSAYNDFLLDHLRKIDHGSIIGRGMSAYGDFLLGYLRQIDHWSIVR